MTGGDRQDPVTLPTESPHSLPPPWGALDSVAETSLVVPVTAHPWSSLQKRDVAQTTR